MTYIVDDSDTVVLGNEGDGDDVDEHDGHGRLERWF